MDWIVFLCLNGPAFVHRISSHVKHPAHDTFADGYSHWPAGILDLKSSFETFGSGHRDRSDPIVSKVLLHLECQFERLIRNSIFDRQRVVDSG